MMSSRVVTGVLLVGLLATTPALAQNARPRGGDNGGARGGDRGGDRGNGGGDRGARGGDRSGSRSADAPRASRATPQRAPEQRSYNNGGRSYNNGGNGGRSYNAPRSSPQRYSAPQQRYDNNNRRYDAPRRYEAPRARQYNQGSSRSYNNGRGYVAPRRDPYYRSGYRPNYRNGYAYRSHGHHGYRPYYGYRGVYGYGSGYRHNRIVTWYPWRPYYYRPRFSIGVYYGAGGYYNYGYTPSYYYDPVPGRPYGGVRITDAPHEAQVFVDGYYVGIVDDFDGVNQHVNLEAGQHRVEVRAGGLDPLSFDVYVQAGRTITLRADAYDDGYVEQQAPAY